MSETIQMLIGWGIFAFIAAVLLSGAVRALTGVLAVYGTTPLSAPPAWSQRPWLRQLTPQLAFPAQLAALLLTSLAYLVLSRLLSGGAAGQQVLTVVWWASAAVTVCAIAASGPAWLRLTETQAALLAAGSPSGAAAHTAAVRQRLRSARAGVWWGLGLVLLGAAGTLIRRWAGWP